MLLKSHKHSCGKYHFLEIYRQMSKKKLFSPPIYVLFVSERLFARVCVCVCVRKIKLQIAKKKIQLEVFLEI